MRIFLLAATFAVSALPARGELPSWIVIDRASARSPEEEAVLDRTAAALAAAFAELEASPTARETKRSLFEFGGVVRVSRLEHFSVLDAENRVNAGPGFILEHLGAPLAVLFSHELEHLMQRAAGLRGDQGEARESVRVARELGAFIVQTRVWVELGGQVRESDLGPNWSNSQDMRAMIEYPWSALTALSARIPMRLDLSRPDARAYWERLLREEGPWRRRWSSRFPGNFDSKEAALFILGQASGHRIGVAAQVSDWLPQILEDAAALRSGERLDLPGRPQRGDMHLLEYTPIGVAVEQSGSRWQLRRL